MYWKMRGKISYSIAGEERRVELVARYILIVEMVVVNIITVHRCFKSKHSILRIVAVLTLYTGVIFMIGFFIRTKMNSIYSPQEIVILLGLTYFFPVKYLYDQSSGKTISIMVFALIHTMLVTYFSQEISEISGFNNFYQTALVAQTIIYIFSTPLIIKFINNKFTYILKNIPNEMNKYLITMSLAVFAILSIIHLYFEENTDSYWKVVVMFLLAFTIAVGYHLIYVIVKNSKNIIFLKHIAYTDDLTGIKNRLALFLDSEELISKNKPFTIIYMDLDNFKEINDTYGHSMGDEYLRMFTKATIETIGDGNKVYRMSGDEFVCLYEKDDIEFLIETFDKKIEHFLEMDMPFLGVSIGSARFPQDADSIDELLRKADNFMYQVKKQNKGQAGAEGLQKNS